MSDKLKEVMELFFEKRESTKPFTLIKSFLMIAIGLIFILGIMNDFNIKVKYVTLLFGIISIVDGIEMFYKKENGRQVLLAVGIGCMWFGTFFFW
ncbi:hypothetical protein [Peribacillus muralis]|uniref:hypothetical protein n=1 Tax=Peribacillus muralis TaxID=264697 RepID=UPI003CFD83FE